MSADLQFKQLIDRILRCREAEDVAKEDTKEVYAELKGLGYDKTAAGALVAELRKRDKNPDQFEERNAVLDLYRDAYERASGTGLATHTHAPEPAMSREDRSRARMSESMADHKELSAEAAALGLISAEAHAETVALSDAIATKFGNGPSTNSPLAASSQPSAPEEATPPAQSSGATPFINPRCQHSDTCHFADSKESCHECLMAWAQRPRDEQIRLWAEANEAARAA